MKYRVVQLARIGFFFGFMSIAVFFGVPELTRFEWFSKVSATWRQLTVLEKIGVNFDGLPINKNQLRFSENDQPATADTLLLKLNEERARAGVSSLVWDDRIETAAEKLVEELEEEELDNWDGNKMSMILATELKKSGYEYKKLNHTSLFGPIRTSEIIQGLQERKELADDLYSTTYQEVAFATKDGLTVFVLAEPGKVEGPTPKITATTAPKKPQATPAPVTDIINEDVLKALNDYRGVHGVSALRLDDNLCRYAEKRVQDLVTKGGLDGHEGFKKDFDVEKNEDLPQSIKDYGYGKIGENLASQYCRNMTTGQGFIAETGVALIEWCFDSSTAGHKEAQLNRDFKDVCIRHGKNMYVIIFGGN